MSTIVWVAHPNPPGYPLDTRWFGPWDNMGAVQIDYDGDGHIVRVEFADPLEVTVNGESVYPD